MNNRYRQYDQLAKPHRHMEEQVSNALLEVANVWNTNNEACYEGVDKQYNAQDFPPVAAHGINLIRKIRVNQYQPINPSTKKETG